MVFLVLRFAFDITPPERFIPKGDDIGFEMLVSRDFKISKHKNVSFELNRGPWQHLFSYDLNLQFEGRDHAGPSQMVTILGLELRVGIYDSRHWNYDKSRWYEYGQDLSEEI